jgi:hypothetical protein
VSIAWRLLTRLNEGNAKNGGANILRLSMVAMYPTYVATIPILSNVETSMPKLQGECIELHG